MLSRGRDQGRGKSRQPSSGSVSKFSHLACGCESRSVGGHAEQERVGGGASVDVDGELRAKLFDAREPARGAARLEAGGEPREALAQVVVDDARVGVAEGEQPQVVNQQFQNVAARLVLV